jgi:hypothetical protein
MARIAMLAKIPRRLAAEKNFVTASASDTSTTRGRRGIDRGHEKCVKNLRKSGNFGECHEGGLN